jgi:hypothetical protein
VILILVERFLYFLLPCIGSERYRLQQILHVLGLQNSESINQSLFGTVGYRKILLFNLLQIEHLLDAVADNAGGSFESS